MKKKEAVKMIKRYLNGTNSAQERHWVEGFFLEYLKKSPYQAPISNFRRVQQEMDEAIAQNTGIPIHSLKHTPFYKQPWFRQLSVAAAFILGGIAIYFINNTLFQPTNNTPSHADLILRGHYKASLQMANGQQIALKPDKRSLLIDACGIHYDDGSTIRSNDYPDHTGRMLSISTPRGGQYNVVLADGSRVRLNAGSTLRFPAAFTGSKRDVKLSGEAYFQVNGGEEDKGKNSFVVHTRGQDIRVLGTAFNVSAYREDGEIRTTLLKGAVQVIAGNSLLLHPGEQAILSEKGTLTKHAVSDTDALAWSDGYFDFMGKNAAQILNELARWYDLQVVYKGKVPNIAFVGKLRRNMPVSHILALMASYHVFLQVEGHQLIVP
ncbi:FecR family protein [bacterium A37T11]|nr:FecR family protein [bacterium A37T11]